MSDSKRVEATATQSPVEVRLMEREGAWSDGGTAWFAREHYPTPASVRKFYRAEFDPSVPYIELRVLARHARFAPDHEGASHYDGEFWVECQKDVPGAFPVWRVE